MVVEKLYSDMYLIRKMEEKLLELFGEGKLFGTVHTCLGQEAVAAGILNNIDIKKDLVFSNHRNHGHYITLFQDGKHLFSEIMGKKTGVCSGKGGSQHIQRDNFFASGIQGGLFPIAAGAAFVEKLKEKDSIVVVFIGDGTLGQGVIYETLNLISLWEIPILIVVENNQYSQSTHISLNLAGKISDRFKAFGIKTREIKTNDVVEIFNISKDIIKEIRENRTPHALIVHTYRLGPHSKGDDFRPQKEIEMYKDQDPILLAQSKIEDCVRKRIEAECIAKVDKSLAHADKSEFLSKEEFIKELKENGVLR